MRVTPPRNLNCPLLKIELFQFEQTVFVLWRCLQAILKAAKNIFTCSLLVSCISTGKGNSMTVSGTSPWLTWPFRPSRTASPAPSLSFRMRRLMHWRSKSPRSRTISKEKRWLQKHTWQSSEQTASYHQGDDCFLPNRWAKINWGSTD